MCTNACNDSDKELCDTSALAVAIFWESNITRDKKMCEESEKKGILHKF